MEPIRIQRRLVQSSSLPFSLLSSLSSLDGFTMVEERQKMVGWSSRIPFSTDSSRPFLPLFGRWFPIYKLSLLYEPQRYVPTRAPILFRLRALRVTLPKYERRCECLLFVAPLRPSNRHAASHRESCRSRGNNIGRSVSASAISARRTLHPCTKYSRPFLNI